MPLFSLSLSLPLEETPFAVSIWSISHKVYVCVGISGRGEGGKTRREAEKREKTNSAANEEILRS
jgi:hypothetical protein